MIVFDASTLVGAALKPRSIPEEALLRANREDVIALSVAVEKEITEVLERPKFAAILPAARREWVLSVLHDAATWFDPTERVSDCRDPTDDMYLELALAAAATVIVSSDADLLLLDPWRGRRILTPAMYLAHP